METPLFVFRLWSTDVAFSQHLLLLLLCGSDFEARLEGFGWSPGGYAGWKTIPN